MMKKELIILILSLGIVFNACNDENADLVGFGAFNIISPPTTGIINATDKTITVTVPDGTDVSALKATFTAAKSAKVTVKEVEQQSGTTANDFSDVVKYAVDNDGNLTVYNVTVLTTIEEEIVTLVNQHRKSMGKNELQSVRAIVRESRWHSKNMADQKVAFGHGGFQERVDKLATEMSVSQAGENVAKGYTSAQSAMTAWLNSALHRENIEGDYTKIGVGVVKGADGMYLTQIFIK